MSAKYIVFDCDGGSDDAWALMILLKAHEEKHIVLLGVTICGSGNTNLQHAAKNMLRILKACGREEIPIFLGAAESLITQKPFDISKMFHGIDGFGDVLPECNEFCVEELVEDTHAVQAIRDFCAEHPQEVTVIGVGPCTNLALCYAMYGTEFAKQIKALFLMGGNYQGVGNFTRAAEFNFYADPEAIHMVLSKSMCPITILPWEPCLAFTISFNEWRMNILGNHFTAKRPALEILNQVEPAQYIPHGFSNWLPCDAILVGVLLFDQQLISKENFWHATVDLKGEHTRGLMVLDHLHETDKNPKNVKVIEAVDHEFFKRIAEWSIDVHNDLNVTLSS